MSQAWTGIAYEGSFTLRSNNPKTGQEASTQG